MDLKESYDVVANDYAEHLANELDHKPFDRKMLDWLIEKSGKGGTICDLGCGPGHIARYLREQGAKTCGIDLSTEMVKTASRLNPDISFQQGNMLALGDVPADTFAGVAAFYSIIHIPRTSVVDALREIKRVLRLDGVLLVTFHIGSGSVHRDEWWDKKVSLDFLFFEREEMKEFLLEAGFVLDEIIERDPYPDVEYPSRRAYLFARRV